MSRRFLHLFPTISVALVAVGPSCATDGQQKPPAAGEEANAARSGQSDGQGNGVGDESSPQQQTVTRKRALTLDGSLDELSGAVVASLDEQGKKSIAIVSFTDESGADSRFGAFIAEELTTRLYQAKRFRVVERRMLQQVLHEKNITLSGETFDPSSVKKLASVLAVDALAMGTYTVLGDQIRLNARLVTTDTADVFAAAGASLPCDRSVQKLLDGKCGDAPDVAGTDRRPREAAPSEEHDGQLKFEFFNMPQWQGAVPSLSGVTPDLVQFRDAASLGRASGASPAPGISNDWFVVRVSGYINIERRGNYKFRTKFSPWKGASCNLDVGSTRLQDNDVKDIFLSPGRTRYSFVFYKGIGVAGCEVLWIPPGASDYQQISSAIMSTASIVGDSSGGEGDGGAKTYVVSVNKGANCINPVGTGEKEEKTFDNKKDAINTYLFHKVYPFYLYGGAVGVIGVLVGLSGVSSGALGPGLVAGGVGLAGCMLLASGGWCMQSGADEAVTRSTSQAAIQATGPRGEELPMLAWRDQAPTPQVW